LHILHFLDNDRSNGSYNGIEINKPTYYTPDHSGLGYALNLRYTEQQYIRIPQLINLTLTSFTISTWIYLIEQIHTVNPIFSQCIRLATKFLRFFFQFSKKFAKRQEVSILGICKGSANVLQITTY
jgi:hypothetical protein